MLGRGKQREIDRLQEEVETLRGDMITLENALTNTKTLNTKLNDRIAVMERHVSDAQRGRETAQERVLDYGRQIDRLAKWFQEEAPDEIKQGGAVDNAVRLLRALTKRVDDDVALLDEANAIIGTLDAEIKQLKLDKAALEAQLSKPAPAAASKTTSSKSNVIKQ